MSYATLKIARSSIANYVPELRAQHNFVRTLGGRWCVVLGIPENNTRHVKGDIWHAIATQ